MKLAEYVEWLREGPPLPGAVGSVPPSVFYLDEGRDYLVAWEVQDVEAEDPSFVVGAYRLEMGGLGEYDPRPIALQHLPGAYHMRALYAITALYHWATQSLPFPASLMSGSVAHLRFETRKANAGSTERRREGLRSVDNPRGSLSDEEDDDGLLGSET